jgi:hypothetical protein
LAIPTISVAGTGYPCSNVSIDWQDKWDATYYAEKRPEVAKIASISYSKVVMELGIILK